MQRDWQEQNSFNDSADFSSLGTFIAGAAVGAGLMFLLDPRGGGRRRALMRDKFLRGSRVARMYGGKFARHMSNEIRGEFAERRARMRDEDVPDDVLVERVRAQIGHVVSHPGAIEVFADNGMVILRGPVMRGEIEKICNRLDVTRGVDDYRIELQEHEPGTREPGLQGQSWDQRERRFVG